MALAERDVIELAYRFGTSENRDHLFARRAMELEFKEFVKGAWHVVEPHTRFVDGPHIDAICLHLQRVTETQERLDLIPEDDMEFHELGPEDILRLIITVPPRSAKSTIVSVLWPAWIWTRRPYERFLTVSYNPRLALRDSVKTRRLIMSPDIANIWSHMFAMSGDTNRQSRYENNKTGYRLAMGTGGREATW